jgi:hypothetical protein
VQLDLASPQNMRDRFRWQNGKLRPSIAADAPSHNCVQVGGTSDSLATGLTVVVGIGGIILLGEALVSRASCAAARCKMPLRVTSLDPKCEVVRLSARG